MTHWKPHSGLLIPQSPWMLPIGMSGGAGGGLDTDTQALLDYFDTNYSYTPDATHTSAYDTFIKALKDADIWDVLDCCYLFAAENSDAALVNIVNPGTFDCTAVNSPTFTADQGFAGDGSTAYLDTGFNPTTAGVNFALNSEMVAARVLGGFTASCPVFGITDTFNLDLWLNTGGVPAYRMHNESDINGVTTAHTGLYLAVRTGASATALYYDGTLDSTSSAAVGSLIDGYIYFLNSNANPIGSIQVASGAIGSSFNATQAADFYDAELAYMQAVGAVA